MNMIQPDRQRNNAYIQLTKEGGRDLFWDSLKFILIFTVVYGHMVETYVADNGLNQVLVNSPVLKAHFVNVDILKVIELTDTKLVIDAGEEIQEYARIGGKKKKK